MKSPTSAQARKDNGKFYTCLEAGFGGDCDLGKKTIEKYVDLGEIVPNYLSVLYKQLYKHLSLTPVKTNFSARLCVSLRGRKVKCDNKAT